jgi:hypothetical protein
MSKLTLLIAGNVFILLFNVVVFLFFGKPPTIDTSEYCLPLAEISNKVVPPAIASYNARCDKYRSFSCDEIQMSVWQRRLKLKLDAKLYYEKPNNFRMTVVSGLGKEADIGSNSKLFWLWAKRMHKGALMYAEHTNYDKVKLKPENNPILFQRSLGFDRVDLTTSKIFTKGDSYLVATQVDAGTTKVASINKQGHLEGFLLSNQQGKTILSAEIRKYEGDCPVEIAFSWPEDQASALLEIKNPVLNVSLDRNLWTMPNLSPQVDLAK